MKIARRFNAGNSRKPCPVPKGRLNRIARFLAVTSGSVANPCQCFGASGIHDRLISHRLAIQHSFCRRTKILFRRGVTSTQSVLGTLDSARFQHGPLAPSRLDPNFTATTGRSDSQAGTPKSYVFPLGRWHRFDPASLSGSLMFLIGLSDRAVLFDPGRSAACL